MNNTKFECSLNDTATLRKLIMENPGLPLLIFCGEEAWSGEFLYEQAEAGRAEIKELTLYKDYWMEKDEYEDRLSDDLCDKEEYDHLSEEEFDRMIKEKVAEAEFVKAIIIYVG